jgi:hypothetical protein
MFTQDSSAKSWKGQDLNPGLFGTKGLGFSFDSTCLLKTEEAPYPQRVLGELDGKPCTSRLFESSL